MSLTFNQCLNNLNQRALRAGKKLGKMVKNYSEEFIGKGLLDTKIDIGNIRFFKPWIC